MYCSLEYIIITSLIQHARIRRVSMVSDVPIVSVLLNRKFPLWITAAPPAFKFNLYLVQHVQPGRYWEQSSDKAGEKEDNA